MFAAARFPPLLPIFARYFLISVIARFPSVAFNLAAMLARKYRT
jgi:hypothetical protein